MMSPGRSATMPTTIWVPSWIVNAALAVAIVVSPRLEADLELTPEGRRLGVQAMGLVGLGRQLDEGPEARPCPASRP